MAMNFAPFDCPCQGASSESKKNLPEFFHFWEIAKNKKSLFLAPTAKNGFNGRNFYYTWIQLTLYNNWQQFGSNRRQKIFRKKSPFYIIFTSENHLNAHSSLIKQWILHRWIAPCQGASSESKKIYLDFSFLRKNAKKQKIHIFGSHSKKMGSMDGTFTIPDFNWPYTITDSNLVRIGDKKIFEKNHVPPLLYNFHFGKSFKRP
jgi:hypothetical protein